MSRLSGAPQARARKARRGRSPAAQSQAGAGMNRLSLGFVAVADYIKSYNLAMSGRDGQGDA